jgi:hypothetical protein
MEDPRRQVAEKDAAARRATDAQVLEDAGRLIAAWNERQAKRVPMLFSPAIAAADEWKVPGCRRVQTKSARGTPVKAWK